MSTKPTSALPTAGDSSKHDPGTGGAIPKGAGLSLPSANSGQQSGSSSKPKSTDGPPKPPGLALPSANSAKPTSQAPSSSSKPKSVPKLPLPGLPPPSPNSAKPMSSQGGPKSTFGTLPPPGGMKGKSPEHPKHSALPSANKPTSHAPLFGSSAKPKSAGGGGHPKSTLPPSMAKGKSPSHTKSKTKSIRNEPKSSNAHSQQKSSSKIHSQAAQPDSKMTSGKSRTNNKSLKKRVDSKPTITNTTSKKSKSSSMIHNSGSSTGNGNEFNLHCPISMPDLSKITSLLHIETLHHAWDLFCQDSYWSVHLLTISTIVLSNYRRSLM
ncbi:hypothetical protein BLOT_014959 [Blomia tropicalis]|nr:hypothetical protein BLOT_014959 [Blomia tropicalis]